MGRTEQNKGRTETGEQIWEEEEAEPRAAEQLQVQRLRRAARAGRQRTQHRGGAQEEWD